MQSRQEMVELGRRLGLLCLLLFTNTFRFQPELCPFLTMTWFCYVINTMWLKLMNCSCQSLKSVNLECMTYNALYFQPLHWYTVEVTAHINFIWVRARGSNAAKHNLLFLYCGSGQNPWT